MLVVSSVVEILWLEEVFDHGFLGLTRIRGRLGLWYFHVSLLLSSSVLVVSSVVEILWLEEVFDHGLLGLTRIKRMTRVTMYYF